MKLVARIDCDRCPTACIEGMGGDMATLAHVVSEARDEGWLIDTEAGDVCPDCRSDVEDERRG